MFVLKRIDTESKFRSREYKHYTKENSAEIQQTDQVQVQYLNTYGISQLLTPILRSASVGGAFVEFCKGIIVVGSVFARTGSRCSGGDSRPVLLYLRQANGNSKLNPIEPLSSEITNDEVVGLAWELFDRSTIPAVRPESP
jgi:hypothetical protein